MIKGLLVLCILGTSLPSKGQNNSALDYSDSINWAVLPTDTTDHWVSHVSVNRNREVDVFYVYPTLLTAKKDERWNYPVGDTKHRSQVMATIVKYQASAWAEAGNFYMPFYRQAHYRAYSALEDRGLKALLFAYEDVRAAFHYYLKHHNKGKGIILAGHSQGSTHLKLLLKEYFDGKPLQKQLIAAYMPGIGVSEKSFYSIPLMDSVNQIGGFVSWNTLKRRYKTKKYKDWYKGKSVVNPVTWNRTAFVSRELHKGFLYSNGKVYSKSFKTHTVDGAIWLTIPHFPFRFRAIFMRNYHIGDVNLFWEDIRVNAALRSKSYKEYVDSLN